MSTFDVRGSARDARAATHAAEPPTIAVRVAEVLARSIRKGEFRINTQLPTEKALAARFGISRPSVREALSALQFAGYVRSVRGSGTIVVSRGPVGARGRTLTSRVALRPQDVIDLLEARLVIEPEVVALAAADPNPTSLRVAAQLIDGMRLAVREATLLEVATDIHIHVALAETCRNAFLVEECKHLLETSADPFWQTARLDAWADPAVLFGWVDQHAQVLQAIAAGESENAKRTSRQHILSVAAHALNHEHTGSQRARLEDIIARFSFDD